ncbi:MAG: glycosyltransferase family 2 protein, partial [Planctomycetota bacterium]|nr:glycosyltransferase family 2 protein [Planctomycetota bacterium]
MSDSLVSIVIPSYQRPESLRQCLTSIERHVDEPHETLVVYVADDEATARLAKQFDVRLIEQPRRDGFVKAANLGFRQAKGRYLIQINDDCEVLPHSIANGVRFLEAPGHEGVGQAAFFHNSIVRRNIFAQIQLEEEWFYVCQVRGLC